MTQVLDNVSGLRSVGIDSARVPFWYSECFTNGMQDFNCSEQLASEHHRLHTVDEWPDGPRKKAALDAIYSTLESLSRHPASSDVTFACIFCNRAELTRS